MAAILVGAAALVGADGSAGDARADTEPPLAVVDLHVDVPWQVHYKGRDPGLGDGQASLAALEAGHYGAIVFPIYLPDKPPKGGETTIADADAVFATIEKIIAKSPAFLPLLAPYAEPGRITTYLSIEGAGPFAADVTAIDRFIARGLRLVSPCHASNTKLASSATGKHTTEGLTELGRQFVERVYAGGALVDVSHVSDATFTDLVPIAKRWGAPIVATHSNARALANQPRNLTDEQLRIIGETGGVAGINFHAPFVTGESTATLDDVVKQILYMAKIAGKEHVAVGSDFDGGIRPADGLDDASTFPKLARALEAAGMSRDDVRAVFGLNALRVLGWRSPKHLAEQAAKR
ncbi:MAG TPA: membrane dipeptidase [Byssovorax sp.]